ncbi:hypothetical protein [Streptomyces sp. NPDC093594]|uniref:hypothetical protein n=1 Tax=Streptomyces sp. NPDC093594 TaxID=3155305 RepID=UPI00344CD8C4
MTEHRDVTSNRFEFYTYRVGRSQLDRLFSIATEGFTPERITFETERSGTRLIRATLEELVSAVAESSLPGDPNVWENLSFRAYGDGKHISIEINDHWFRTSISGPDATWVHGQTARLKAIVEPIAGEVRPWEIRHRRAAKIGLYAGSLTALATLILLRGSKEETGIVETITGVTLVGATIALIVWLIGTTGKGKKRTHLSATEELSDTKWWQDLSASEKIALGGLGVAALAAIATSLSAYADVWGS